MQPIFCLCLFEGKEKLLKIEITSFLKVQILWEKGMKWFIFVVIVLVCVFLLVSRVYKSKEEKPSSTIDAPPEGRDDTMELDDGE